MPSPERWRPCLACPYRLLKPLVGDNAFAHKLDVHLRSVLTYAPLLKGFPQLW